MLSTQRAGSRATSARHRLAVALLATAALSAEAGAELRPTPCRLDPGATLPAAPAPTVAEAAEHERSRFTGGKLIRGHDADHYVAFTFDDGPKYRTTPRVLAALERYDVPGTFFVVARRFLGSGKHSRRNLEVLHDAVNRGHHIGNHSMTHKNMAKVTVEVMKAEIEGAADAIEEELGVRPYLFRPPYGGMSERARAYLSSRGYTEALWSIDSLDFRSELNDGLRRRVVKKILAKNGGVVLMHDTKEATARALAGILDDLEAENCRRLGAGDQPIIPVSMHYFIRDGAGERRAIPPEVAARTERYTEALPERCEARGSR